MVTVDGQKMGKSLGNFVTLKDAFVRWSPQVIRLFILQSHYRSPLDFSQEAIEAAATGLERLGNTVRGLKEALAQQERKNSGSGFDGAKVRQLFLDVMDDDFNTPQGIAVLFDFSREINSRLSGDGMSHADITVALGLFDELAGKILGLSLEQQTKQGAIENDLMGLVLEIRKQLRLQKNWDLSDRIRDSLLAIGIAIEDKKEGASWKRSSQSQ